MFISYQDHHHNDEAFIITKELPASDQARN